MNNLQGLVGDMNIHFDNQLQSLTKQTLTTLSLYSLVKVINKPTYRCGHIIDWVIVQPDDDIHRNILLQTHLNQIIIALNPTSMFQSLSLLPHTGLLGTWLTLTVHHLMLNFLVYESFHLLKRRTSTVTFCALYYIGMHPPSLLKVMHHNSTPWFDSMRDELLIAKRERRQLFTLLLYLL